jgi:hypothetical protein
VEPEHFVCFVWKKNLVHEYCMLGCQYRALIGLLVAVLSITFFGLFLIIGMPHLSIAKHDDEGVELVIESFLWCKIGWHVAR